MTDVTPPKPPSPKAAGKGLAGLLKGKPAWVWVAGVTVLLGVAYLAMRRGTAPEDTQGVDGSGVDDATGYDMATGDYGGYYPVATQGAYGGWDQPQDWAPVTPEAPEDNAGNPEPTPVVVNVGYPAPSTPAPISTGGGKPAPKAVHTPPPKPKPAPVKKWNGHPLSWWQNPKHNKRKGKWRWPDGRGFVHSRMFMGR